MRALDPLRNAAIYVTNLASARRYQDVTAVSTVGKLLLTPEEAAGVLSIGRTKLYELLSSDEIVSIRVGDRQQPGGGLSERGHQPVDSPSRRASRAVS